MTRGRYVSGEEINRVNALAREQKERIAVLEAAARRVSIAWPYFQELTDYVEFESAMHDLTMLAEEVRP